MAPNIVLVVFLAMEDLLQDMRLLSKARIGKPEGVESLLHLWTTCITSTFHV